jgi:hypothetical protein
MPTMLFSSDPVTRVRRVAHTTPDDDLVIETHTDVTDVIEANRASYNRVRARDKYGEMTRVASIPMGVYMDLKKRGIADDEAAFTRWLDDSEQLAFRTRPGKLNSRNLRFG